jgi:hypothetical protein
MWTSRNVAAARYAVLIGTALLGLSPTGQSEQLFTQPITLGAWKLDSRPREERWLIVRMLPSADDPNYHVEVLQQAQGDPVWKFTWVATHLSITDQALRQSIRGASARREGYPETFDSAYHAWLASNQRYVCATTVSQCLK